jgi:hypothetical protein
LQHQDLNLGFNKIFNFDANFQSIPFVYNTQASAIWSFGLTAFAQRRFRDPIPSSFALYLIPSVSYIIAEQWNVSLGVEALRRRFDSNAGFYRRDSSPHSNSCRLVRGSARRETRSSPVGPRWTFRRLSRDRRQMCQARPIASGWLASCSRRGGAFDERQARDHAEEMALRRP